MSYINDIPILFILFTLIIYLLVRYMYLRKNKQTINLSVEILFIIMISYVESLLYLTIFPSPGDNLSGVVAANIVPFHTIIQYIVFQGDLMVPIINLVGNIVVFIPLGMFAPLVNKKIIMWQVFLFGLACSMFIEITQFIFSQIGILSRSFDVDDLILNSFGVIIGYMMLRMLNKIKSFVSLKV